MTPAEGRKQKEAIRREIAREEKRANKAKIEKLRAASRTARAERPRKVAEAKAQCAVDRVAAREACKAKKAAPGQRVKETREALRAEVEFQRAMRRIERANKLGRPRLAKASVRRQESDDEVRANLPPELVPFFERVRGQIRGSDRQSRTEAFLHYAEEHPKEGLSVLQDEADAALERLLASRPNPVRRAHNPPTYAAMHGGLEAQGKTLAEAPRLVGPWRKLGDFAELGYITDKGDGDILYQHEFEGDLPIVVVNGDGDIVIIRGASRYRVEGRGIVG